MITFPASDVQRRLGGTNAPLVFSATGELAFITCSFTDQDGNEAWDEEPVYRDGSFVGRYQALSEKVGDEYRVRREGGWPAQPAPHVEEKATGPTGGQAMGAIYHVDLAAQPSQNMTAAGSYTIDGHTWWAKGPVVAGTYGLVHGQGIQEVATSSDYGGGESGWRNAHRNYPERFTAFPLAQLSNYNPLAPLVVMWRMQGSWSGSINVSSAGLTNLVQSSDVYTAAEKAGTVTLELFNPGGQSSYFFWDARFDNLSAPGTSGTPAPDMTAKVQGIYRVCSQGYCPLAGLYDGTMRGPEAYLFPDRSNVRLWPGGALSETEPAFFWCNPKQAYGYPFSRALTDLWIMQPRVP